MTRRLSPTAGILLSIYLPSAIVGFGYGMILPTVPDIAASFAVAPELVAQMVTANLIGRTAFFFPAGFVVDRIGRKHALVVGPILQVCGALVSAFAPWFGLVLAAQLLIGAGDCLWSFGREVAAVEQIRPELRGRVMGSFFGISVGGITLGPVLGGLMTVQFGYRSVFLLYACMALVVLAIAIFLTETRARPPRQTGSSNPFVRLSDIDPYFRTTFVVIMFATFCSMLRSSTVQSMVPIYVVNHLGYTPADAGLVFGVVGLLTVLMIAPAGYLSDTYGRKAATVPAALLVPVGFVAFYLARDLLGLWIAGLIVGIAAGLGTGTMTASTYDIIPAGARGRFQALRRTIGELGGFTGPVVGGAVASAYDPGVAFLAFAPVYLVCALLLVFVARESLASRVPRRQPIAEPSMTAAKPSTLAGQPVDRAE